ncbi:hypothetical protein Acr_17g0002970 [Actinidia rufa]|uniref:Uncharacterized protein n=1 Tax=Actinidia rufa TaxID=165716 RepID=A0A7J0G1R4_9ERIC|nr:hypothetical protein Acr_17g0002970 [Actinidia rufa]
MPLHFFIHRNKKGETPHHIFTDTQKDLVKSSGEWLTNTSQSFSVVSVLIAGVGFATPSSPSAPQSLPSSYSWPSSPLATKRSLPKGIAPEVHLRLVGNLCLDLCNAGFVQCRPLFCAQGLAQVYGASSVRHNVLSSDDLCNGSVPALLRSYKVAPKLVAGHVAFVVSPYHQYADDALPRIGGKLGRADFIVVQNPPNNG